MATQTNERYNQYVALAQQAADYNNAAALLGWDQEVYMPAGGAQARARQLATLATAAHQILTSEKMGALLHHLAGDGIDDRAINFRTHVAIGWDAEGREGVEIEGQAAIDRAFAERQSATGIIVTSRDLAGRVELALIVAARAEFSKHSKGKIALAGGVKHLKRTGRDRLRLGGFSRTADRQIGHTKLRAGELAVIVAGVAGSLFIAAPRFRAMAIGLMGATEPVIGA